MISHCPSSNLKLASGIAEIPELLSMGCNVSIAADGAACSNNMDMFTEMRHAALIQKTRLLDPTAMPAETVFEMATLGGAKAMGKADKLGSLEIGKTADIAIVKLDTLHNSPNYGRNIIAQMVYSVRNSDVITVIIDGQIVMKDRNILTLNTAEILADAERVSVGVIDKVRELGY